MEEKTLTEQIHAILLGFHYGQETFVSANEKIQQIIAEECQEAARIESETHY